MAILGIDIGGTMIKVGFVHQEQISQKKSFLTPKTFEEFQQLLSQIVVEYAGIHPIDKVAFSVPGSVNESGTVFFGGAVPYLNEVSLADLLKLQKVKVVVENDAKAATLGEMTYGHLKDVKQGAAIILGTGVGVGICMDGKLYKGNHFQAGEVSFMIRDRVITGMDSFVGVGLSAVQLVKKLAEHLSAENDGKRVFEELAMAENAQAQEVLLNYCKEVATLCFNIQSLLDIEKIVIGGGISQQACLIQTIQTVYQGLFRVAPIIQKTLQPVTIEAAKFKADANLIGAAAKGVLQ
ncbi:ROK family protein [Listeria sp. PSOL-1]|uniref:ROK family protein n=1 Tax=Listeria sp. PSOL-1 TaxID=1844999 RepID=UPI0013D46066|nr:ROK family protein [Listeria sp. PSOL-1]